MQHRPHEEILSYTLRLHAAARLYLEAEDWMRRCEDSEGLEEGIAHANDRAAELREILEEPEAPASFDTK